MSLQGVVYHAGVFTADFVSLINFYIKLGHQANLPLFWGTIDHPSGEVSLIYGIPLLLLFENWLGLVNGIFYLSNL